MSLMSVLRANAERRPHGRAILDGDESRSWRETSRRIAALAAALRSRGLAPGEHVTTLSLNSARYFELLLAVWWAGGVLVPLNTRLAYEELRFILDHSEARFLVTDETFAAVGVRAREEFPTLRDAFVLDDAQYGAMIRHTEIGAHETEPDALAGIFYTGGTTGLPKGVQLTHGNFAVAAANMRRDLALDGNTVYLHATPLFHLADFGIGLGVTLGGGCHAFMARFSPEGVYRHLRSNRVTHLSLVPTMLAAILDTGARGDARLEQIERICYGAAPIAAPLLERVLAAFPKARIHQFYGMTECCGACVMLPPERHVLAGPLAGKLGAAGRATDGFELRIGDEAGAPLPAGEVGEIQIRGPAVMSGYWRDEAETAKAFAGDWLRSGDGGFLDPDGFLHVVDRLKDMVISGGENIYCAEVENAIASHPAVETCAVIGLPDDNWGERLHAVVVARPGTAPSGAELEEHCRTRLAGYKVPKSYEFMAELPLSGVGKVQKNVLRNQHAKSATT